MESSIVRPCIDLELHTITWWLSYYNLINRNSLHPRFVGLRVFLDHQFDQCNTWYILQTYIIKNIGCYTFQMLYWVFFMLQNLGYISQTEDVTHDL
jgi:hypothetical protein